MRFCIGFLIERRFFRLDNTSCDVTFYQMTCQLCPLSTLLSRHRYYPEARPQHEV